MAVIFSIHLRGANFMRQKRVSAASRGFSQRAALLAACLVTGAQATTYTITSNTMAVSNDGTCGFMEALAANNFKIPMNECPAPSGATTINLAPLTYTPPWGIEVWANVNIRCPSGTCTIDAGSLNEDLFTIDPQNNPNVSLYRLTLRQPSGNTNSVSGLVVLGGVLNMDGCVVNGFRTVGLSIRAGTGHNILRSTFTNNGYGFSLWDGVGLVSQSNTISNNWMGIQAGSVRFNDFGSIISNNTDAGIWLGRASDVLWEKTTIRGNRNRGVYIAPGCEAKLNYCVIERNTTSSDGGGMYIAAVKDSNGTGSHVVVNSSTISNNKAAGNGGGVYVTGALTLINVTLSNDTAARGGGAYYEQYTSTSYLDFDKSTVAFNRASLSAGGLFSLTNFETFHTAGSIIAQNSAPSNPDVSGKITSRETMFGNITGFTGSHDNDHFPANPLLGPLMDNAGPNRVQTHALLKGSPAINKGTQLTSVSVDARGLPRPTSGTWDLGAYEVASFETELLTVIAKSSDTHVIQNSASLSNSAGTVLSANALGDYVTYAVAIPEPGTYNIAVGTLSGPNRPIVELATTKGIDPFVTIGSFDMFKPNEQPGVYGLSFSFTSASIKYFRFKVTGRNGLNTTGYKCFFDYIRISKQ
jgi:predicted outer membrane repeat protein